MELSNKSIVDIRDFLDSQKVEGCNLSAIPGIIDILNEDKSLDLMLVSKKVNDKRPAFERSGIICYSDSLKTYIDNEANRLKEIFSSKKQDFYNYMLLLVLLHEVAHVNHINMGLKYNIDNNHVIAYMYYLVYFVGKRNVEHYQKSANDYVFEYNANMEALRLLRKIFPHKFGLLDLNNSQLQDHLKDYYRDGKFISERTFDAEGIQYDAIEPIGDIPTRLAIMHGLPVSDEVVREIQEAPISRVRRKYDL